MCLHEVSELYQKAFSVDTNGSLRRMRPCWNSTKKRSPMRIDTEPATFIEPVFDIITPATPSEDPSSVDVETSYDGSNVVFRLLRMETWGPSLMNLGYYRFPKPFMFLNLLANMEAAQQRLVIKAVELLKIERQSRVLDIACGRGKSSFMVNCMYPDSHVVGLDLLEPHVQVAQTLFNQVRNLSYSVGDAEDLDFPDSSFDRVMCLEAAFHFPDRAEFLREVYRVLRPGGRLVVVDFAWNTEADRIHRDDADTKIVRDIWQWDDFFSVSEYEDVAESCGFQQISSRDWSRRVTHPIQHLFGVISRVGNYSLGRRFLEWKNPLFRSFSKADWKNVGKAVRAHLHLQTLSKYMAFVFEKPLIQTAV